jgi:hypothetical protein
LALWFKHLLAAAILIPSLRSSSSTIPCLDLPVLRRLTLSDEQNHH